MSLKAEFNTIIVKPQEEPETTHGSIIVPDLGKENALKGTIISVGPGYYCATGEFVETTLKEGQQVILPPVGPTKIEHEGQEYWSCPESQISALIVNDDKVEDTYYIVKILRKLFNQK